MFSLCAVPPAPAQTMIRLPSVPIDAQMVEFYTGGGF